MELDFCQEILMQELSARKQKNSAYSLRAFARDLGIGSTSLSDCLSQKRKLSKTNLRRIAEILRMSPLQMDKLMGESKSSISETTDRDQEIQRLQLAEDSFRLIAEWHYLAILNLAKIRNNQGSSDWVAQRLGIAHEQAATAIARLQRLGYLDIKRGKLVRTSLPISTTRDIPSNAIKQHHNDNLKLAETALWSNEVADREFSSVTMAVDPKKLPEVKELLMKAKRKAASILSRGDTKEVYTLSFQLFPLTKVSKSHTKIQR